MGEEGGIDYTLRIEGLDIALERLRAAAAKVPAEADRVIEDGAENIFWLSQNLVPVDTGTLQRSGSHNHSFLRSVVGYNTPYAIFVEEGTFKMMAQPYLRPAVETYLEGISDQLRQLLQE